MINSPLAFEIDGWPNVFLFLFLYLDLFHKYFDTKVIDYQVHLNCEQNSNILKKKNYFNFFHFFPFSLIES